MLRFVCIIARIVTLMGKLAISCLKGTLFLLFFFCYLAILPLPVDAQDVYAPLRSINSPAKRLERAIEINRQTSLSKDTTRVLRDLNQLHKIATDLEDKPLECLYYGLMANQYSIIADRPNIRSDEYHQKAVDLAKTYDLPVMVVVNLLNYGYYHYNYRQMVPAYKYFLEADLLLKDLDPATLPQPSRQLKILGYFYYYIKEYGQAIHYLKSGLKYPTESKRETIDINNTIGLCYALQSKDREAIQYYNKATALAEAAKDTVWVGIVAGNTARLYLQNNEKIDLALEKFKLNRAYSIRFDEPLDAMLAIIDIAGIQIRRKEWKLAEQYLNEAETFMAEKPFFLVSRLKIADMRATIAESRRQYREYSQYLRQYVSLKDSLEQRDNSTEIEHVRLFWEKHHFDKQREALIKQAKEEQSKKRNLIIFSSLLVIILILFYSRQRLKNKHAAATLEKQKIEHQLKQQQVELELETARLALINFTDNLREKNKIIEHMRSQIELMDADVVSTEQYPVPQASLQSLLETHLMTEESWKRFKGMFLKVYPSFFREVLTLHPSTSESELRILSLLRLELNNREIAELLGITIDGVKKAKQRLRKKVGALPGDNIPQTSPYS